MSFDDLPVVRRTRLRRTSFKFEPEVIYQRVFDFFERANDSRDEDVEQRLQRYAKYRMWTDGSRGPWPGASDIPLPDLTEKSLRLQDTLHNAVMAQRPAITAAALIRANQPKEAIVDQLLDYQFFVEAKGEKIVGDMAEAFINDGVFTVFIPWVREQRRQSQIMVFDPIPPDAFPSAHFTTLLRGLFGPAVSILPSGDPDQSWDFDLEESTTNSDDATAVTKAKARFYTREDARLEAVIEAEVIIYDGPLPRVLQYDDVFHPPRAANLQPPGPSNPGGAAHVIVRDYPTKDEIARLQKSKFYDRMSREEVDALLGISRASSGDDERQEVQKDDLAGQSEEPRHSTKAPSQDTLTRLTCFDRYDINGDGLDEDVIWWVLLEPRLVVRARVLQEVYPSLRPDHPRPFAEAAIFPVAGRRAGFSMLEMLEGLHDAMKKIADQTIDANTMGIIPFGFYRASSSVHSESIALAPGELYPLSDPSRDVSFPQIGNPQAQAMAINLVTLLQQFEERVSVIGDLQLGRVPAGKATALRTSGNLNLLAGQGEARPERILRRFFCGFSELFAVMHDLNQYHLPKGKQIRLQGPKRPGQDPYLDIQDSSAIYGRFQFEFKANALNTSKQQLQQTLQTLLGTFVNQLALQLGIATPETIYNLLRDYGLALGADPEGSRYLNPPATGLLGPRILAEEALTMILQDQIPDGIPAEAGGWIEHLQKLLELEARLTDPGDNTGEISPRQAQVFQGYKAMVAQRAEEQQAQLQAQAAAQQFAAQQGAAGNSGGAPATTVPANPTQNPQLSGGAELIDESLPSAGGGANP